MATRMAGGLIVASDLQRELQGYANCRTLAAAFDKKYGREKARGETTSRRRTWLGMSGLRFTRLPMLKASTCSISWNP